MKKWTIKETDQSYRFLHKYSIPIHRDICHYYRTLALSILLFTFLGLLASCAIMDPFGVWMGINPSTDPTTVSETFLLIMTCAGVFEYVLAIFCIGLWLWSILKDKYDSWRYRNQESKPEKRPSLISTWIKSKHDKVCLLIEVVDKDGNPIY